MNRADRLRPSRRSRMDISVILFILTLIAFACFAVVSKRIGDKQKAEWMNPQDH